MRAEATRDAVARVNERVLFVLPLTPKFLPADLAVERLGSLLVTEPNVLLQAICGLSADRTDLPAAVRVLRSDMTLNVEEVQLADRTLL